MPPGVPRQGGRSPGGSGCCSRRRCRPCWPGMAGSAAPRPSRRARSSPDPPDDHHRANSQAEPDEEVVAATSLPSPRGIEPHAVPPLPRPPGVGPTGEARESRSPWRRTAPADRHRSTGLDLTVEVVAHRRRVPRPVDATVDGGVTLRIPERMPRTTLVGGQPSPQQPADSAPSGTGGVRRPCRTIEVSVYIVQYWSQVPCSPFLFYWLPGTGAGFRGHVRRGGGTRRCWPRSHRPSCKG